MHTPVVRAGSWIFATGLRATNSIGKMDDDVLQVRKPYLSPGKSYREAEFIFQELFRQLKEAGGDIRQIARLDQYYPTAHAVDPYHSVRRGTLDGSIAPSTSVIVRRLLNLDATMDIQVIAPSIDSGYVIQQFKSTDNIPQTSGYAPCVRVGDLIFLAGQLARDSSGTMATEAMTPTTHMWNGTRVQLETNYLIEKCISPILRTAGSRLDLILKAQVYLTSGEDFSAFWYTWSNAFKGNRVPPTTVIPLPHPAFGLKDATVEINIVAAHESSEKKISDIDCDVALIAPEMIPARRFGEILFVAGLFPIGSKGLISAYDKFMSTPFYIDDSEHQMAHILETASTIFEAAGSNLSNVVRAIHFHRDLNDFKSAYRKWSTYIGDHGLPFTAIEVGAIPFLPNARLLLDLWGYIPNNSKS